MLYNINETEVINSKQPHPPFVTEYSVVGDDGTVFLRTKLEDKAVAQQHMLEDKITVLADMREL